MKANTLTLYYSHSAQVWMSVDTDPRILELFGTNTLPTSYGDLRSAALVKEKMEATHPNHLVLLVTTAQD